MCEDVSHRSLFSLLFLVTIVQISELEGSLRAAIERLATELASKVQLMKDMGEAERKVNEKKAVLEEEKVSLVTHTAVLSQC